MDKILSLAGVGAALYLLSLSGPEQPDWLFPAAMLLLLYCIAVVSIGLKHSIDREDSEIQHDADEHRDNAI